jgi:hypothetical protein
MHSLNIIKTYVVQTAFLLVVLRKLTPKQARSGKLLVLSMRASGVEHRHETQATECPKALE